jgi:ApbE superfamily uncharacterized protein (UPF0280 family)
MTIWLQIGAYCGQVAAGSKLIIENGGDIAIAGNQEFRVGVFAGDVEGSGKIGFLVRPAELPIGICTSSGTVGHSISFGEADALVAIAREASVADAAATSIANAVKGTDVKLSINNGLERAKQIPEVLGCLAVRGKYFGTCGKLPELIGLAPDSQELSTTSKNYRNYGLELTPVL